MQLQRLRDLPDPLAPELAAARDLLRATRPLAPSLDRMQRVRQALRDSAPPPAMAGSSLLAKATLVLLAVGVTVGLLLWAPWLRPPRSPTSTRQPHIAPAGTAVGTDWPALPAQPAAAPPPALSAQPAAAPPPTPPAVPLERMRAKSPRRLSAAAQHQVAPAAPPLLPAGELPLPGVAPPKPGAAEDAVPTPAVEISDEADPAEASLVLSATQALRQRREPAAAVALLGEYHSRFPQGALQEEALALHLECLVALADPQAGARAREYLQRYPRGRFRAFAAAAARRYPADQPLKE
jgi:hypothetical protein